MRYFFAVFFFLSLTTQVTFSQSSTEFTTNVVFPAGYSVGDYIEFVKVLPIGAGESGYYEISISYTRNNVAAAATFLASVSHANPSLWREVGRINSNGYAGYGSSGQNFTIDCNTAYGNARFRVRAVGTLGDHGMSLPVYIKVRSINLNNTWTALSSTGNDLNVNMFLPMTNDWSLYVGNPYFSQSAHLAIKAIENGNVGIGTISPSEKLSVNGKIRAQEIKVEAANWPDYVFDEGYELRNLESLEKFISKNKHLPEMPSEAEVKVEGVELGEMNKKLLKKIEELTLYVIELNKKIEAQATIKNKK